MTDLSNQHWGFSPNCFGAMSAQIGFCLRPKSFRISADDSKARIMHNYLRLTIFD